MKKEATKKKKITDPRFEKPKDSLRERISHFFYKLRRSKVVRVTALFLAIWTVASLAIYALEHKANPDAFKNIFDSYWYVIVTVSTVGYGDKFPVGYASRIVGMIIILIGVAAMGTVTGNIASFLVERQMRAGKGLIGLSNMENHFIVCGWKKDLAQLLRDIMAINPNVTPEHIVLINKADTSVIDDLRSDPEFAKIKFIFGDHNDENVLLRANIRKAKTVLLLADQLGNPTPMETDSRTVMAAMTIEALNKKIYTCAELLDAKFEKHLKLSDVDEIILSRDTSRVLLANASSGTGVSHVIDALIGVEARNPITVIDFPTRYIGKTFKELNEFFTTEYNDILIGVLENTGNLFLRKQEALKDAQKTPDISKLVENLQNVKNIVGNDPVINPGDDYIIQKNTRAIIIKSGAKKDE